MPIKPIKLDLPEHFYGEFKASPLIFIIPLQDGMRLQSAARQMRKPTGAQLSASALARALLARECHKPDPALDAQLAQLDPAYLDTGFHGKTLSRAGRDYYRVVVPVSLVHKAAITNAALQRDQTMTQLLRDLIAAHLPELPKP